MVAICDRSPHSARKVMRNAWRKIGEKKTERMSLILFPELCFFAFVLVLVAGPVFPPLPPPPLVLDDDDDVCSFSSFSTSSNSDSAFASYPTVWSYTDRKPNKKNNPVAT